MNTDDVELLASMSECAVMRVNTQPNDVKRCLLMRAAAEAAEEPFAVLRRCMLQQREVYVRERVQEEAENQSSSSSSSSSTHGSSGCDSGGITADRNARRKLTSAVEELLGSSRLSATQESALRAQQKERCATEWTNARESAQRCGLQRLRRLRAAYGDRAASVALYRTQVTKFAVANQGALGVRFVCA
jgi:hypothetical protein